MTGAAVSCKMAGSYGTVRGGRTGDAQVGLGGLLHGALLGDSSSSADVALGREVAEDWSLSGSRLVARRSGYVSAS